MEHIQSIILGVVKDIEQKQHATDDIQDIWKKATNKKIRQSTLVQYFKKSIFYVIVKNSAWKYELSIKKESILKKLNKYSKKNVKDIRLRVGEINGKKK